MRYLLPLTPALSPKGRGGKDRTVQSPLPCGEWVRVRGNCLSNRHFTVQIDVLNRINQLHAVGHRFLKRLTAQDQTHAPRAFVDHRRAHRI